MTDIVIALTLVAIVAVLALAFVMALVKKVQRVDHAIKVVVEEIANDIVSLQRQHLEQHAQNAQEEAWYERIKSRLDSHQTYLDALAKRVNEVRVKNDGLLNVQTTKTAALARHFDLEWDKSKQDWIQR